MYAVFQNGGKQHLVREGQTIRLEKIDVLVGNYIEFKEIMLIVNGDDIQVGRPFIIGGKITAEVVAHGRGDKIVIIKFQRRKHFRKHQGHRQWFTDVKISCIKI